jgi:hypothetical protein
LTILALHLGSENDEARLRPYFGRQEFRFTPLLKKDKRPDDVFGFQIVGSAVLIGADGKVAWRGVKFDRAAVRKALGLDSK